MPLLHIPHRFSLISAALLAALAGCASGPDFQPPRATDATRYTQERLPTTTATAAGTAQTLVAVDQAPTTWWTQFGNPALNQLVSDAIAANPSVARARATLAQAREEYIATASATQQPQIDASLSARRQQVNVGAYGISGIPSPGPFTLYGASVDVSYDFDIAGGQRRALEALAAQVDNQSFEWQAAQLAVAGNVVTAVIQRAALREQIALTQRLADTQAQQLAITRHRLAAGGVSQLDVEGQQTLLAQTRAGIPPLHTQLAQTEHRLATLLGGAPSQIALPDIPLQALALPATLAVTLPSTLARERPDIRAAEALLHAASAQVGVATANLYPRFMVSASAGSQRPHIADIVNGLNIWNIGLGLTQPLFHGGELRARKRAAAAAQDAALAHYQQTVLTALQQVADTLTAIQDSADELQQVDAAERSARASLAISTNNHAAGGISQWQLLDSQRQALQTALAMAQSQARRLTHTATLYQALGRSVEP